MLVCYEAGPDKSQRGDTYLTWTCRQCWRCLVSCCISVSSLVCGPLGPGWACTALVSCPLEGWPTSWRRGREAPHCRTPPPAPGTSRTWRGWPSAGRSGTEDSPRWWTDTGNTFGGRSCPARLSSCHSRRAGGRRGSRRAGRGQETRSHLKCESWDHYGTTGLRGLSSSRLSPPTTSLPRMTSGSYRL